MKSAKKMTIATLLAFSLLQPAVSHAWFFFFVPLGLFSQNDKKAIDEMESKQDWKGLLELSEARLKTDEKNPDWMHINGFALQKLNRCREAVPKFEKALELKPDYVEAHLNLGACLVEVGDYDRVIATQTTLIERAPDRWQPYFNVALSYVRKGDPVRARAYLEQLKSRNMVWAEKLETLHIQPLEARIERDKVAAQEREREESARAERELLTRQESQADTGRVKQASMSIEQQLSELKQLYSKGLLSKDVYSARQKEILTAK